LINCFDVRRLTFDVRSSTLRSTLRSTFAFDVWRSGIRSWRSFLFSCLYRTVKFKYHFRFRSNYFRSHDHLFLLITCVLLSSAFVSSSLFVLYFFYLRLSFFLYLAVFFIVKVLRVEKVQKLNLLQKKCLVVASYAQSTKTLKFSIETIFNSLQVRLLLQKVILGE